MVLTLLVLSEILSVKLTFVSLSQLTSGFVSLTMRSLGFMDVEGLFVLRS